LVLLFWLQFAAKVTIWRHHLAAGDTPEDCDSE